MRNGENDPQSEVDSQDTPTERVAINRLSVDVLDAWLDQIRERRLATVHKLESVARVRADEVRLEAFLRFQRQHDRAKNAIAKLDEQIVKVEAIVHKCRLLAMAAELEVGLETEDV